MVTAGRRDRAQLILVAAIAVAFIVLGLVVVVNGVLYTQTVSSGTGTETTTDVGATETELERGVQGLLQRENLAGELDSDALDDTVDGFAADRSTMKADQRPAIVGVRVDDYGEATRISDEVEGDEWEALNASGAGEPSQVGYFSIVVDSDEDELEVDTSESDDEFEVEVGPDVNDDCRLDVSDGERRLDLVVDDGTCELDRIDPSAEYERITIEREEETTVEADLIVEGESTEGLEGDDFDAVWNVTATATYDSNEMTSNRTGTIELYEGEPYHAWPHGGDDE